ncbi:MAG: orotate phosphoribosyltransferase [Acidimicrobiales bacterium]
MASADPTRRGLSEGANGSRTPFAKAFFDLVVRRGYTRCEEPFVLSSGQTSYDYVDLRKAVADGADLEIAARALIEHLDRLGVDYAAIGGMTMGADPFAHAVALLRPTSWFSVRKAEKSHGSKRRIEGADLSGERVVLLEDTASTGGSILSAYEVVNDTSATVVHACALLDRGDQTARTFSRLGVSYSSVLSYRDLGIEPIVASTRSN